jgi:hypothetical protein
MRELERQLGFRVLDRTTRQVLPGQHPGAGNVESYQEQAQTSAADLAVVNLTVHVDLAIDYFAPNPRCRRKAACRLCVHTV